MTNSAKIKKTTPKKAQQALGGRVFKISLKGIPLVDAQTKARLDAAARAPGAISPHHPQLATELARL